MEISQKVFIEKLERAKECLGSTSDAEFARTIGIPPSTLNSQKKKTKGGKFPEDQLFALKVKRPELNLDMDYILLGTRREVFETMEVEALKDMPKADFSDKTGLLVQYFLNSNDAGRATILAVAKSMAITMPKE